MSLYTRLIGVEYVNGTRIPRVPPAIFIALAAQVARSEITGPQAGDIMNLSQSERTEAAAVFAKIGTGPGQYSRERLQDILTLASTPKNQTLYKTEATLKAALGVS